MKTIPCEGAASDDGAADWSADAPAASATLGPGETSEAKGAAAAEDADGRVDDTVEDDECAAFATVDASRAVCLAVQVMGVFFFFCFGWVGCGRTGGRS